MKILEELRKTGKFREGLKNIAKVLNTPIRNVDIRYFGQLMMWSRTLFGGKYYKLLFFIFLLFFRILCSLYFIGNEK